MNAENTNTKNKISRCVSITSLLVVLCEPRTRLFATTSLPSRRAAGSHVPQELIQFAADLRATPTAQIIPQLQHQVERRQLVSHRAKCFARQPLGAITVNRPPRRPPPRDQPKSRTRQLVSARFQYKAQPRPPKGCCQHCAKLRSLGELACIDGLRPVRRYRHQQFCTGR